MTSCQGLGGTGTHYTYAQLEGLWINAGGAKAAAPVAAAIAEAESGGCSTALNPTDNNGTQSSFGLWQISNGTHNPPVANIYDAAVNAGQAVAKYKGAGNSFAPWGTYNSGAYKAYLSGGTTPDTNVPAAAQLTAATTANKDCLISFGGQKLIPVVGPTVPQVCLTRGTVRAVIGGLVLVAGGAVMMTGTLVLVAFAFRATGALRGAANVAAAVPGGGGAAERLQDAHGRVTRTGAQAASQRQAARRREAAETARQERRQAAETRRQAAAARRAAQQPRGRHARTGPNAPPTGKHAAGP